jgi:hypothetical protein
MSEDLSIAGPGSPVSLKKFILQDQGNEQGLRVLIDNDHIGIAQDDPSTVYLTVQARKEQWSYFMTQFDGERIPAYLYRYLHAMFGTANSASMKYSSDLELKRVFETGELTRESEEYIQILNLIKFSEYNPQTQQLIGMIQLVAGTLNLAKKSRKPIRLFIEHPETHLHPKTTARFMWMFDQLRKEYEFRSQNNTGE